MDLGQLVNIIQRSFCNAGVEAADESQASDQIQKNPLIERFVFDEMLYSLR
jgi:hypothetical protein